jgi:integrase
LKSFGLRVSQGGTKTFIVLIGSGRRQSIGRYPLISLSDARKLAKRLLAEKTLGKVRPTHTAFDDARNEFLAECERENRPRTVYEYRRLLARHYPYGRTSVASIASRDIFRRLANLADTPAERHNAFTAGRAFFRWCVRQRLIDRSPLENSTVPAGAPSRERVLSEAELAAVYRTAVEGDSTFHRIVALLVLTGQRRGEIAGLEWAWINDEGRTITLPSGITKNKRAHAFPYGLAVAGILATTPRTEKTPFVFPAVRGAVATVFNGWGKAKAAFDKEMSAKELSVAPRHLHDLRRTLSSGFASLQVSQTVVERILNHVSGGTLSPIAQVYNRYSYMDEMREALERWEQHLAALIQQQ